MTTRPARLTLGPLRFNWPAERQRDFYFRIADEAPVDIVYVGEVVCIKRAPFAAPILPEVIERLERGGKQVVLSTLALVSTAREQESVRELVSVHGLMVEANDLSAVALLVPRPHVVGPLVSVYNEGTLGWFARNGAQRIVLPAELSGADIARLAAAVPEIELEVHAFGRVPLAVSARCYHARSHGLHKDGCRYVCAEDPDGMEVATVDGEPFLAVNGTETMSYRCVNLLPHVGELEAAGVGLFRLSPQATDMVRVADIFRDALDGKTGPDAAVAALGQVVDFAPFADGFYRGRPGAAWGEEPE